MITTISYLLLVAYAGLAFKPLFIIAPVIVDVVYARVLKSWIESRVAKYAVDQQEKVWLTDEETMEELED
jgi:hypothetical protein